MILRCYSSAIVAIICLVFAYGESVAAPIVNNASIDSGSVRPVKLMKKDAIRKLDRIRSEFKKANASSPIALMAKSSESGFKALAIFARCFDKDLLFSEELEEEENQFVLGMSKAGLEETNRVKNAMLGIYGLNAILYKIRFHSDTTKMKDLLQQHDFTVKTVGSEQNFVPVLSILTNSIFNYLYVTVFSLDTSFGFRKDLSNCEFQFGQGERVARDDEDHFLNAVYRLFELNRLWGLTMSKNAKKDFGKLTAQQKAAIDAVDNMRMQTAVGLEYYYRVIDLMTRTYIQYKM
jgi:hypothetical protein